MLAIDRKKKKIPEIFLFWAVIAAYSIINILLIKYHEPWRDEAQQWLVVNKLSLLEIIDDLKYEGHPCLWYLILYPFVKSGFPYITANLVSFAFMLIGVYLFLKYSPFPFYVKIFVVFSPIFVYYYPVISRSYCLIPFFVALLAILYPDRHKKTWQYGLIIGLLIQTHALMLGMAGMLMLFWVIESFQQYKQTGDKKQLLSDRKGILIPILSIIFLFFQWMNVNESAWFNIQAPSIFEFIKSFFVTFSSIVDSLFGIGINNAWIFIYWFVILLIITMTVERKKAIPASIIIVSGSLFFELVFYISVYGFSVQKIITCVYILLWGFWVEWKEIKVKMIRWLSSAGIVFLSMLMMVNLTPEILLDVTDLYSDSKNLASYINENLAEDSLIVTNSDPAASSIIPFLKNRAIWNPVIEKEMTYIKWNHERLKKINDKQLIEWIKKDFPDVDAFYLIFLDTTKNQNFIDGVENLIGKQKPIYQTKGITITEESYDLYLIPVE